MPLMAYSPLGQAGRLLRSPALAAVAQRHDATPGQVALAWCLRAGQVMAIPKASTVAHVRDNAGAASIVLTAEDVAAIDAAHPPPARKQALAML
jgi:diketogulonate reductase-like aldo/keto reductase